jgi:hypothetical protein
MTNFMKQIPSRKANSRSASKEYPRLLWNRKFYYRIHKIPSLVAVLNHTNPVHTLQHPKFKVKVKVKLSLVFN